MPTRPTRRTFLFTAAAAATARHLPGCAAARLTDASPPTRLPARTVTPAGGDDDTRRPANARVINGWPTVAIGPPGRPPVRLAWSPDDARAVGAVRSRLRVTCAWDVREDQVIEATLAGSGRAVGRFDLRLPYPLQPFEIPLSADDTAAAVREGLHLTRVTGQKRIEVFAAPAVPRAAAADSAAADSAATAPAGGPPAALLPHLLVGSGGDPGAELRDRLASLDTLQPFGWFAGCVTDAQWDLSVATGEDRFRRALDAHLGQFLTPAGRLVHERILNVPSDGVIPGVEFTLPVAALARRQPTHPFVDQAVAFWEKRRDADGCVQDDNVTSTEGAYTVGYPMAVVAAARADDALTRSALRQLVVRLGRVARDGDVYQRVVVGKDGKVAREGKNWARGVAWWMLGLARTLAEVRPAARPPELTAELARVAAWAQKQQSADGLWPCFVGEPETGPEASGSAGIAAALAIGARAGLLPPDATAAARRAYVGLRPLLTPDGQVGGVAQRNAGGAALQRGGYRVIAPFATGLIGQLVAALRPGVERG